MCYVLLAIDISVATDSVFTLWHPIFMCCWKTQCCQCSCSIIYSCIVLFPIFIGVLLFSFVFGSSSCSLLWPNTSFNISGKSFSKVRRNLSHSNCIGSIWNLYLILICIALVPTWLISSLCAFLMLVGSTKLMLPMWLLSAILTLSKYSRSTSHFQVWYMRCDESLVFTGATCLKLLHFSLTFNCLELTKLLDILDVLLLWLSLYWKCISLA